jgi:hypothetical protein
MNQTLRIIILTTILLFLYIGPLVVLLLLKNLEDQGMHPNMEVAFVACSVCWLAAIVYSVIFAQLLKDGKQYTKDKSLG